MRKILQNHLLIIFGWISIALGMLGVILPILPTTPFMIAALIFFSKSSPRFHQMLLNNAVFGPALKEWEEKKVVSRQVKYKATFLIIISFSISLAIYYNNIHVQLYLIALALVLLFMIWRIKEEPQLQNKSVNKS
ncbi:MAG: YbaN family protein [Gammaproteobacteria bacterium]|nr:YbaN family protein [Gammaproteobacteria bacterium]